MQARIQQLLAHICIYIYITLNILCTFIGKYIHTSFSKYIHASHRLHTRKHMYMQV